MANTQPILAETNLFDFFRQKVETAVAHQRTAVSANTVYYLSGLLADGGHAPESEAGATTLVELRERAASAPFAEAVTLWRRLGDTSLLTLGFFRESLERRRISRDYYEQMGAGAYGTLRGILRDPSGGPDIFGELAEHYRDCAEVIAEVRDESREENDTNILKLYEEWEATGSVRIADKLRKLGVIPMRARALA